MTHLNEESILEGHTMIVSEVELLDHRVVLAVPLEQVHQVTPPHTVDPLPFSQHLLQHII